MLAEVLLVLAGYPSSLITPGGVSPSLTAHLHPGEVSALSTLGALAANYRRVRDWAESTQAAARAAVLARNGKGKGKALEEEGPGQYVAVLAGAVRAVLADYTDLLVRTEASILASDASVVQADEGGGFVPLSLLLATFDEWQAPLSALAALVARLSPPSPPSPPTSSAPSSASLPPSSSTSNPTPAPAHHPAMTPGELMHHLSQCASTGHPILSRVFTTLLTALWRLFLSHLCVFLLDGVAPEVSTPSSPALGLDAGADPPHRLYRLDESLIPASVGASTRESILYVGRVAATLKREGRALPRSLTEQARALVSGASVEGLDAAVQRTRADVGEWLWTHILTGQQVADAIETL